MMGFLVFAGIVVVFWSALSAAGKADQIEALRRELDVSQTLIKNLRDDLTQWQNRAGELARQVEPLTNIENSVERVKSLEQAYLIGNRKLSDDLAAKTAALADINSQIAGASKVYGTLMSSVSFISGKSQHSISFLNSLGQAKTRLVIVSGWIRSDIVNNVFIAALADAKFKRDVSISIFYGDFQSRNPSSSDFADLKACLAVLTPFTTLRKIRTHKKILICDDKVYVGSRNWLNAEASDVDDLSVCIESKDLADKIITYLNNQKSV
jgi:hypothetical protein